MSRRRATGCRRRVPPAPIRRYPASTRASRTSMAWMAGGARAQRRAGGAPRVTARAAGKRLPIRIRGDLEWLALGDEPGQQFAPHRQPILVHPECHRRTIAATADLPGAQRVDTAPAPSAPVAGFMAALSGTTSVESASTATSTWTSVRRSGSTKPSLRSIPVRGVRSATTQQRQRRRRRGGAAPHGDGVRPARTPFGARLPRHRRVAQPRSRGSRCAHPIGCATPRRREARGCGRTWCASAGRCAGHVSASGSRRSICSVTSTVVSVVSSVRDAKPTVLPPTLSV